MIADLRRARRWWRNRSRHPIYLREQGKWGRPNAAYETLRRYSPFAVMGALLLGACAAFGDVTMVENDVLFAFWCLLCLPGLALSALSLFAAFMLPALVAPLICVEQAQGTWEMLRVTPLSMREILAAKTLGALSRLKKFWSLLMVFSLGYGALIGIALSLVEFGSLARWGWLLGLSTFLRPWFEITTAVLAALLISTWADSTRAALVGSYTAVFFFRLLNSELIWSGIGNMIESARPTMVFDASGGLTTDSTLPLVVFGWVGPTAVYVLSSVALLLGLLRRAGQMELG